MNPLSHETAKWLRGALLRALPPDVSGSVVEWAEKFMRLVGSARTEMFDRATAPWLNEVIECAKTPGRYTFIKPVQSGGTTAGEIILSYWVATWNTGDVGYFWPNDSKADDRWLKYTEKRLKACGPVMARVSQDRFKWVKGNIFFPHLNFSQLGVRTDRNLSSDTIRGIVCEELHDVQGGWEPGKLEQVYARQQAVWNAIAFNISNAGFVGTELHKAFESGTQEHWEVMCPGCHKYHVMRARWEPDKPHLGGLRYDADGCRRSDGSYDYVKLAPTVRYQMPCGYVVHDTPRERRELSLSGRYSAPHNTGAMANERSFTLEAVAVHDVRWLDIIRQKHRAMLAMKLGDPHPWYVYLREQECRFADPRERPLAKPLTLTTRKKDRAGMAKRMFRFASLDYQEGEGTEMPHWWLLIEDVDEHCNVLVVWEGKCEGDTEAVETLRRHEVNPIHVCVDSSFKAKMRVYDFCLAHGYNAIKVEGGLDLEYKHEDGSRHFWSEPEPLWRRAGRAAPTQEDESAEPEFWLVSDQGAMDLLNHIRAGQGRRYEIPEDVSDDFKNHFSCWALEAHRIPATNEVKMVWKKSQDKAADHLFKAATYVAVQIDMVELIGPPAEPDKPQK